MAQTVRFSHREDHREQLIRPELRVLPPLRLTVVRQGHEDAVQHNGDKDAVLETIARCNCEGCALGASQRPCRKRPIRQRFLMFVPSLSWQRFGSYYKMAQTRPFPLPRSGVNCRELIISRTLRNSRCSFDSSSRPSYFRAKYFS